MPTTTINPPLTKLADCPPWQRWTENGPTDQIFNLSGAIATAKSGGLVVVVEGQETAERLTTEGFVTTIIGGPDEFKKWHAIARHFQGADVAVIPDHDESGWDRATYAATKLREHAHSVKVLDLGPMCRSSRVVAGESQTG